MSDAEAREVLLKYQIGLTVPEARTIEKLLQRPPTLVEAVIWGIQGSEHSSYKSSKRFLKMLLTEGKHVILGPKEDSGIVAMTDGPMGKRWGIVVSHESHNHPSQIVPFEGAATGIGGTVRDVACMGARVIGCMDLLRLGDLTSPETRTIAKEVIRGIGGYGNPLGIPNLGGDTYFDSAYNSNCLVNAIAIGIVREDQIIHSYVPEEAGRAGYDIMLVGKPTDRSGFGGAAFASLSIEAEKEEQNTGAVQEPNPFLERHLLASTYALFDWLAANGHLGKVSFKDLGAGGVVCATVEQVAPMGCGAEITLDAVHVSIPDLPPEVIACSETQERMCWTCHPSLTAHILRHYNEIWDLPGVAEGARASVIGTVTSDGIYRLHHHGQIVCEARAVDITQGLSYERPTVLREVKREEPEIRCEGEHISCQLSAVSFQTTIQEVFRAMLTHRNHASKSPVFVHYDKDVIGNTLIEAGETDASVITPLQDMEGYLLGGPDPKWHISEEDSKRGVAIAGDGNPRYGRISAYWQGVLAVSESLCNVAAVGATPRALTDCLNYGNPEIPEHLAALEEGVRGIADAARCIAIGGELTPVISGNVSLYNSLPDTSAIPPSALVCCIGILRDARKAVTMQFKAPNTPLFLLGERRDECGGSAYYEVLEELCSAPRDTLLGSKLPQPHFDEIRRMIEFITEAIDQGLTASCHDISDGGLLLTLFEMTVPQRKIGGDIGVEINLDALEHDLRPDTLLFSQTPGFVLEARDESRLIALARTKELGLFRIGQTVREPLFTVHHGKQVLVSEDLKDLHTLWENGLKYALGA